MRKTIRALLLMAAFGTVAAAAPARAEGIHAAIAISTTTGAYGYAFNFNTEQQARDGALSECRKRTQAQDCRVYATFFRQCVAIARSTNNAFGWALGYPNDERPERALNECAARNGQGCKVVERFCSGTSG